MFFGDEEEDADVVDGSVTARTDVPDTDEQPIAGTVRFPSDVPQGQTAPYQVDLTGSSAPPPPPSVSQEPYLATLPSGAGVDATQLLDLGMTLASSRRAQTAALFVKVPLLAYVALSDKLPGVVRLGAAVVGAMELLQVLRRREQTEAMLQQAAAEVDPSLAWNGWTA